jgi:hypothetical protein
VIDITPSYADATAGATSETYNIIDIDAFTATQNATGDTGLIRGLNIGNLTQTETAGTITANAIKVGTGWDSILDYNGTTVINGSGQVVSTQITGTLFTLDGDDADTEAIAQGNTLLVAGGTNGIDTDVSATDTITLNLDTTEIGTTTFGSGTGFTWTFDAGTTDPTLAFGDNSLTIGSAATLTATDVTTLNCTDCIDFDDLDDTLDLDANLTINQGTNTWSQSFTGTTGTGFSYTANSLTTGEIADLTATFSPTAGGTQSALDINLTNSPSTSANTLRGLDIAITDATALENALYGSYVSVDNSANTSTGTHSIYGGYFTAAGKTAGTTTAIGLYASASGADNNYAAIFASGRVGIGTSTPGNALDILSTTQQLRLIYSGNNSLNFTVASTGAATLYAQASASSSNDMFKLTTDNLNASSIVNVDHMWGFQATSGSQVALQTSADFVPTSGTATFAAISVNPTINQTGGASGISRGIYINPTLTSAADWRSIEVATGNVLFATTSGSVGVGDTTPDAKLEIISTTEQLRLTHTDGTYDARFTVDSTGYLTLDTTGDRVKIADTDVIVLGNASSDPATSTNGAMYYNTTDNKFRCYQGGAWTDCIGAGGSNSWTDAGTYIYPTNGEVLGNSTSDGANKIAGIYLVDDAGITFGATNDWSMLYDETTDDRLELTTSGTSGMLIKSASTTGTGLNLEFDSLTTGTGALLSVDAITTGTGLLIDNAANTLTTGTLLQVQSTATSLTSAADAFLGYLNWNPGSTTTATGDLFRINIGSSGNVTNLLNVTDNGSTLFSVSETQITSTLPHQFTASGDVVASYDLVFTNQTASVIDSYGPLTIRSGEPGESNSLTLKTYNSGDIILDLPSTGQLVVQGAIALDSQQTLTANSTTPSVDGGSHFVTANTSATVITNFTNGTAGQLIYIEINDANTDFDCTASNLSCGTTDITNIETGDTIYFIYDGTNWNMLGWVDDDANYSVSGGADIAEYFPSVEQLSAGDVVRIDPERPEHIIKSTSAYENKVLGIVSTNPGIILGKKDGYPVALAGRVPVKISPTSSAITPGDYLTTSSQAGYAMKAQASGKVIGQALESWSPDSGKDTVMVFINNTYIQMAEVNPSGNINLVGNIEDGFFVQYDQNQIADKKEGFAEVIAANLKAGIAEIAGLSTNNIKTAEIKAQDDGKINIKIGSQDIFQGKIEVTNQNNEIVYSLDEKGNAVFAGKLEANEIKSKNLEVSESLKVNKIYADEIIAREASFENLRASTTTGVTREEIEALLAEAQASQQFISQSQNWSVNLEKGTANLDEISLKNLYATEGIASSSLSVTNSVTIGSDMVIQKLTDASGNVFANSIETVDYPLVIQGAAMQPISLMAGKILIDTEGNVQIQGNLAVTGSITTSSLNLKQKDDGNVLSFVDTNNEVSGFITASGSAQLKDIKADQIKLAKDLNATSSATLAGYVIEDNASAGKGKIIAGTAEVKIKNSKVNSNSLIYITPTSPTQGYNLYIKSQDNGEFIVGFENPINSDITFNWWIVELSE